MKCLSRADIEAIAERVLKAYYQLPQNKDAEIYRINPEQLVTELLGLKVEYENEFCDYVLWIGNKRLLKRKKLDEFLEKSYSL